MRSVLQIVPAILILSFLLPAEPLNHDEKKILKKKYQCSDISNDGQILIYVEMDELELKYGKIIFQERDGDTLGFWAVKENTILYYNLSDKGTYCLINVSARKESRFELFLLDKTGKELSKIPHNGYTFKAKWSPIEDYFLLQDGDIIKCFNIDGTVKWIRGKPENAKYNAFEIISQNGKYICISENENRNTLINNKNELLFRKDIKEPEKGLKLYSLYEDIDSCGNVLVKQFNPTDTFTFIYIFDKNGNEKNKVKLAKKIIFAKFDKTDKDIIHIAERGKKFVPFNIKKGIK